VDAGNDDEEVESTEDVDTIEEVDEDEFNVL
jgi:hypothetical protein